MDDLSLFRYLDSCHKDEVEDIKRIIREGFKNQHPWLVNTLVDYYFQFRSKEALSLIQSLPESQSQHLFEKLSDSLSKKATRLPTFELILHLFTAQLSWLYRLVSSALFNSLLKFMKSSTNVLALTYGVFVVTTILPLSPIDIAAHLPDIFEIFSHLVERMEKEAVDGVPRILLLHLQVGLYYFFLQLYAMFPCNVINYLRVQYGTNRDVDTFKRHIEPLLRYAKVHPKLILSNQDLEKDRSQWLKFETTDIAVLDQEVCLDATISLPPLSLQSLLHKLEVLSQNISNSQSPEKTCKTPQAGGLGVQEEEEGGLVSILEEGDASLSQNLGHVGRVAPADGWLSNSSSASFKSTQPTSLDEENSTSTLQPGQPSISSVHSFWSPSLVIESAEEKSISQQSSHTSVYSSLGTSGVQSAQASCLTSPALDGSSSSTSLMRNWPLVPASSARTTGTYSPTTSTLSSAYVDDEVTSSIVETRPAITRSKESLTEPLTHSLPPPSSHAQDSPRSSSTVTSPSRSMKGYSPHNVRRSSSGLLGALKSRLKSVFRSSPDSNTEPSRNGGDDSDDFENITLLDGEMCVTVTEVKENESLSEGMFTLSPHYSPKGSANTSPQKHTGTWNTDAVSTTTNNESVLSADSAVEERSKSSPDIYGMDASTKTDREASHSMPPSPRVAIPPRTHNSLSLPMDIDDQAIDPTQLKLRALFRTRRPSLVIDSSSRREKQLSTSCPTPTATPKHLAALQKPKEQSSLVKHQMEKEGGQTSLDERKVFDAVERSNSAPNNAARDGRFSQSSASLNTLLVQSSVTEELKERSSTLTSNMAQLVSPVTFLDACIKNGSILHYYQPNEIPLPDLEATSWTHFGTCPHQEELAIVQCQVCLLNAQLLFERYKCLQHIQRNRRLLSKASKANALTDEIRRLEQKIRGLEETLKSKDLVIGITKETYRRESEAKQQIESRAKKEIHSYHQRISMLLEENSHVREELKVLSSRNHQMLQKYEKIMEEKTTLESRYSYLKQQVALAKNVQDQMVTLKKEKLVLGEWHHSITEVQHNALSRAMPPGSPLPSLSKTTATADDKDKEVAVKTLKNQIVLLEAQVDELNRKLSEKVVALDEGKANLEGHLKLHSAEKKALENKLLTEAKRVSQLQISLLELQAFISSKGKGQKQDTTPNQKVKHRNSSYKKHRRTTSQPASELQFTDSST